MRPGVRLLRSRSVLDTPMACDFAGHNRRSVWNMTLKASEIETMERAAPNQAGPYLTGCYLWTRL